MERDWKMMHEQNENITRNVENIKKNQTEIPELKNTTTEMKNSFKQFRTDVRRQKTQSVNLKKVTEIIESEEQKGKETEE